MRPRLARPLPFWQPPSTGAAAVVPTRRSLGRLHVRHAKLRCSCTAVVDLMAAHRVCPAGWLCPVGHTLRGGYALWDKPCGVCPAGYALRGMPCGVCPAGYALRGVPCGVCHCGVCLSCCRPGSPGHRWQRRVSRTISTWRSHRSVECARWAPWQWRHAAVEYDSPGTGHAADPAAATRCPPAAYRGMAFL